MKSLKLLKKKRIIFLYHYFLIEENENDFAKFIYLYSTKDKDIKHENLEWFKSFVIQKNEILEEIRNNLIDNWKISRIPILEKSVLSLSIYEMKNLEEKNEKTIFFIINRAVEISKRYFDFEKHKYINKILDNVGKKIIKNKF